LLIFKKTNLEKTRRSKMSLKKSGIVILVSLLVMTGGSKLQAQENEYAGGGNTKIFTVFVSKGCSCPGPRGRVAKGLTTNDELLKKLQSACKGVDFIARDITKTDMDIESVYNELGSLKKELDGVLIIGLTNEYRLAFTGLPTIYVNNLFEWMNTPYRLYLTGKDKDSIKIGGPDYKDGRIITAQLDRRNVCSPSVTSAMFEDLIGKINLIQAVKRLKESRILVVTRTKYLAEVDYQGDKHKHFPENYNETYTRKIKELLGVELVKIEPEEFYEVVKRVDFSKAEEIAQKWINEAEKMTDTTKFEVIKTAKSYLALEALRKKYKCNAISTHMRSLTGSGKLEDLFNPGLGLMEFQKRGIQAICQEYENVMVAHLLGYFIAGRPSMLGDIMMDTGNDVAIIMHCGAPLNPYGDDRRLPYVIRSHAESPVKGTLKPGSSTGAQVEFPENETVTIWKVYVLHKKIGLFTGKTVDGHSLYKDFDNIMCTSKLVAKVDNTKKILKHSSPDAYGIHRAVTFSDLRQQIKDLAVLIGFEVIEEDR
jgi:hypothetical protein